MIAKLMINRWNDGKHCADCRYFHLEGVASYSQCTKQEIYHNHFGMVARLFVQPSRHRCNLYQQETGKNHCECGCFLRPMYKYCPNCGKKNKYKPEKKDSTDV